ncbi:hypothetical protein R1sor_016851 [Riccia sorocarpa]|uniref:Xyloglucan endotransglucosylase/hydrolase n=1 Tax=Riccia sorocarpa TaxID=122646 RepID=A0ABD3HG92_9MARC
MADKGARGALVVSIVLVLVGSVSAGFFSDYNILWGPQNIRVNDATGDVQIQMANNDSAGVSFASKASYLFGSFSVKYKLVPDDSAGTVTAFFLHSDTPKWDEIDFEFLGNVSGQPYLMHTNIFADGVGGRESQFFLWFDPTAGYHNYTILWNRHQVVWLVDSVPVRVHVNSDPSVFPHKTPLHAHGTIYDASTWATRGGAVPLDWSHAPFVVSYRDFTYEACMTSPSGDATACAQTMGGAWEQPQFQSLSTIQRMLLRGVRSRYMTYDYCLDRGRYPTLPAECVANAAAYSM